MNDDWFDFLASLLDSHVRFLVVGAHALAVHGVPRATQDIDVWIEPTHQNATRVWKALSEFGAPVAALKISVKDFATPGMVVQIGLPPNRIDLLTTLSGLTDFESAWNERVSHAIRGRTVDFIGRNALLQNKRAAGRKKDLADVEALGE